MDEQQQPGVARAGMAASVVAATAASICCVAPIVAVTVGMSSLMVVARYAYLRPLFIAVTIASLAVAFYATYRRREAACEPGSACAAELPGRFRKSSRAALWLVTALAFAVLTFPSWAAWVL